MILGKYSFGIGDRFAQQGKAQLKAFFEAFSHGIEITPVWNKSYREHKTVNTIPQSVRMEADDAVHDLGWNKPYLVDADHINIDTVESFLDVSDFFTIDVANYIGIKPDPTFAAEYINKLSFLEGKISIEGISDPFEITRLDIEEFVNRFIVSIAKAKEIYSFIENNKKSDFIIEVSMDEVEDPQSPTEMLLILASLATENIPVQTIAPKFTGRFNKGVDYVGDIVLFQKEFEQDILVIDYAIQNFSLPESLKLSVHSGSDKFSIYRPINLILKKHNKGIHIKTAGTTWLEELAGLAISGEEGLKIAKQIYASAIERFDELTLPYATVIDVNKLSLPNPENVNAWSGIDFFSTLSHNRNSPKYNTEFRQMLHVAYKIAAEMGDEFIELLRKNESTIAPLVTDNIYFKHIKPVFID